MLLKGKAALGLIGAGAAGGAYYGFNQTEKDSPKGEKLSLIAATAGAGATAAGTGILASRSGLVRPAAHIAAKSAYKNLTTKTGMLVGGGAALGTAIGAYSSDDKATGAAKGAVIGAGGGLAARGAIVLSKMKNLPGKTRFMGKTGLTAVAMAGAVAVAGGIHAFTHAPGTAMYSGTSDSGETYYSESPIRSRSRAMNASGNLVLGLHSRRH